MRRVVGPDAVVGGTARNPIAGRRLVEAGATYLGVGPTFATRSKVGLPAPIGLDGVRDVAEAVAVPVIAIAGITAGRVPDVLATGAWGVAAGATPERPGARRRAGCRDHAHARLL